MDEERDWVKEERLAEVRVEEMVRPQPRRPQYQGGNYPGQELNELIRSNAQSAEAEHHRFDEQNN
jgi:hypothetical protein